LNQALFCPPAPTPRDAPLNLFALLSVLRTNPLEAWSKAHFTQPLVRGGLPFLQAVVVSEPAAIQRVLLDNAGNYRKDDFLLRILAGVLDNGLLTVDGDQWRRQRRAVAPLFARKSIFTFAPRVADAGEALAARWNRLPEGSVIDIADEMTRVTLDVLRRTIFSQGIERDIEEFQAAMRNYFDTIGRIDPFDALGLPEFLPRPTRFRARASLRFFNEAVNAIISKRRHQLAAAPDSIPRDLLTLLLEARDPHSGQPLDERELRANIFTFIAAGHETTANALTWSLYLLSQDREWAARVAAEAELGTDGEDPCAHLVETRAVIEESLRLYPPIAAISRAAINDDELADEPVRAGTMVIVAPYVVHRHELLWSKPDSFNPNRFLGRARDNIHRFSYLPFGAGPRICIGAAFALQEASLLLSTIMKNFTLSAVPGHAVEPLLRITLRPRGGLPLRLQRRTH
jgi:cytochrome P450